MEINFSGNNSIDVNVEKNEKCFMCCNTTEYNEDGNCGVTIGDIETMKDFGWDFQSEEKLNSLEIGGRYDSEEYGDSAFIIRIA